MKIVGLRFAVALALTLAAPDLAAAAVEAPIAAGGYAPLCFAADIPTADVPASRARVASSSATFQLHHARAATLTMRPDDAWHDHLAIVDIRQP